MARGFLEVEGAQRLRSTLRQASEDLQNVKDVHAAVAKIVENAARSRAPTVTGALAGTVRSSGTKTAAIVRAGYRRTPYAGPNNWGWPGSSPVNGSYSGSNFITDAAAATEPVWVQLYVNRMNQAIQQVEGI